MTYQKVEINCPNCGSTLIYEFSNMADWGTSCPHNQNCPDCNEEVAIMLGVGCPDDIGIPDGWRTK